jgi:hypothetical protein
MSNAEVWLRGPLPDIPRLLQPVAHALLQAREDVEALMLDFPEEKLWTRPGGAASAGFHLQHLRGVLDRLFSYARNKDLNEEQMQALASEGKPDPNLTTKDLVSAFRLEVDRAIEELRGIDERILTDYRSVGRAKLPSTVIGLLFHAAEHAQRHTGQLLVTVRIQRA